MSAMVRYYVRSGGELHCLTATGIKDLHEKLSKAGFESVEEIMEVDESRGVPFTTEERARRDYVDGILYRTLVELAIPQHTTVDLEWDHDLISALRKAIGLWLVRHGLKASMYDFYPYVKEV